MSGSTSSWLSNLASKAETVLNQIDETAATALHTPNSQQQQTDTKNQYGGGANSDDRRKNSRNGGNTKSPSSRSRQMRRGEIYQQQQHQPQSKRVFGPGHVRKLSSNSLDVDTKVTSNSRPSSVSSTKSNKSEGALPLYVDPFSSRHARDHTLGRGEAEGEGEEGYLDQQDHSPKSGIEDSFSQVTSNSGSSYLQVDPHNDSITLAYEEDQQFNAEMLSSLSQENKLLKSELQSLTQELNSALNRQRDSESRLKRLNQDYDLKCHEANEMFRKLQNVELDLSEEIKARDSQIAGYRVKVNELSDKIAAQNESLQQINNEKIRILSDHHASSGVHEESVTQMQTQLKEAQEAFNSQIERERREKEETQHKLQQAEDNIQTLTAELREVSGRLQSEKQTSGDYLRQLNLAKQSVEESRSELSDYKNKAVKILQAKEKLIAEMKMSFMEGSGTSLGGGEEGSSSYHQMGESSGSEGGLMTRSQHSPGASSSHFEMMKMELSQYRSECELLREEVGRVGVQLERAREELSASEQSSSQHHLSLTHDLQATHHSLQQEKHKVAMLEEELSRNKEELNVTSRELLSVKEKLSRTVAEKDQLISKLQAELISIRNRPQAAGSEEFEARIRTLTDTLLSKQSQIERLNSEKQSLNFQLERMALENSSANGSVRSGSTRVNMMTTHLDDDGLKAKGIPLFCRESAFDNQAIRLMKKGLLAIDSFSLTVGVYFRRFALARVFIVIYALLLHLWVTIVILTYKPEMHSDDFQPQLNPRPKLD